MKIINKKSLQGFTLIELLIVIAVLGVLAAVVLVAINPLEQLARGRDAGRKSTASQLKNSVLAYYTARAGTFPKDDNTWVTNLQTAGELNVPPAAIGYAGGGPLPVAVPCTPAGKREGIYCYDTNGTGISGTDATSATNAILYVKLESAVEDSKCPGAGAYYYWQYSQSLAGVICVADGSDPTVGTVYVPVP